MYLANEEVDDEGMCDDSTNSEACYRILHIYIYLSCSRGSACAGLLSSYSLYITIMILSFPTDRSGQTVQTQIRLLLEEQSDQGLHCLLFHLHLFDEIPKGLASFLEF